MTRKRCMVCRAVRPPERLSVIARRVAGHEEAFPEERWDVRYCNDRPACREEAVGVPGQPWLGTLPPLRRSTP